MVLTEAQIEVFDDQGQVHERVRIVGDGEVALDDATLRATDEGDTPDAVIRLRNGVVTFEAKIPTKVLVNGRVISARVTLDKEAFVEWLEVIKRKMRVRTITVPGSTLLGGRGAVIRSQPSQLEAWAAQSSAQGARVVAEQLARLRAEGKIDENGKVLVELPDDMKPGSGTDV